MAAGYCGVPGEADGVAAKDDVEEGDQVHDDEEGGHGVDGVFVVLLWASDADQHEGDAELDRDDGDAEEDFEEEEPLSTISWMLGGEGVGVRYHHALFGLVGVELLFVRSYA